MPMEIALLPVIESAFNPKAYSRAKASGIWQFIPSTGKNYGLAQDLWKDNRRDIVAATDAALNYLQRLHDMFGNWELALAAYNCGEGNIARAIAYNQKRGLATDYLAIAPRLKPETRNYVPKLIAVKNIVLSPPSYGIELDSVPDVPYFTTVQAPQKIDVKVAAMLAGMSEDDFVALNPAHTRPVAAGAPPFIVPLDKADTFRASLEAYDKPLVSWTTYAAKKGEALDAIARSHHLSSAQLKAANEQLYLDKRGRLRSSGQLMVPMVAVMKTVQAKASPSPVAKPGPASVAAIASLKVYTVRSGDTLFAIAQRYRTGVDTLLGLNDLTASTILHPGLKLRLP